MTKAMTNLMTFHEKLKAEREEDKERINKLDQCVKTLLLMTSQLQGIQEASPMVLESEPAQKSNQSMAAEPPPEHQTNTTNTSMTNNHE